MIEKLSHDFDINLPEFKEQDIEEYLNLIKKAVSGMKEWDVTKEIYIDIFSYQKYIMFKDLVEHNKLLYESDLVKAFVGDRSALQDEIAETQREELFLSLRYNVYRYGMENTVPGVMKLLKGVRGDVADNIRRMPDFVVQHPKTNEVFFIEVKFRRSGKFDKTDDYFTKNNKSIQDYPYVNAYFIVVTKKHIKCLTYDELEKGDQILPLSKNFLSKRTEFGLDRKVIIKFCKFAVKFFKEV